MKISANPGLFAKPTNKKKIRKLNPGCGSPQVKVSDEDVREIIYIHLTKGYSAAELARIFNMVPRTVRQWLSGDNRSHLLRQVQEELEKTNGRSVQQS